MSQQNDEYKPSEEFGGDYFSEGAAPGEQILEEPAAGEAPKQDFSHFAQELAGGGGAKPAILKIMTDRRFYLPLGLFAMIYIVYLFMSGGSKTDTPNLTSQDAAIAQQQERARAAQTELSTVVQLSQQNQTQIKALTSSIQQLQATQSNLNTELTRLGNSMSDLSFIVQKMVEQQKAQKKPVVKKKVVKKRAVIRTRYHVRAVVPGRAWIEQPNGATLTVAVGDTLQGYGTIININTTQGVVYTSSGARISYKPHYSRR